MSLISISRLPHYCALLVSTAALTTVVNGQTLYLIRKSQFTFQTDAVASGTGVTVRIVSPPTGRSIFTALTPEAAALALPDGTTRSVSVLTRNGFELGQSFATSSALDAAFPNGTYRITGTSMPELVLALAPDSYPASEPATLRTNWTNGLNIVDPAQNTAFTFGSTSSYAAAATGARMSFRVTGLTDEVNIGTERWNRAVFGFPATPGPLTSFTIPAGTLASGRVYQAELVWDIATTLDTTSVQGVGVVAAYSKINRFYLVARAPGDTAPEPPVIASQPTNQSGEPGGSATFAVGVTVGGTAPIDNGVPTAVWFREGQPLPIDGAKYALTGGVNLTVNSITAADVGRYFAQIINPGGTVTTISATLSVTTRPAITRQPASVTVAPGSTAVFSVATTGSPALAYQWRLNNVNLPNTFIGATGPTLLVPNVSSANAGTYTVIVSNPTSTVASAGASLGLVSGTAEHGRLSNLSILTPLTVGESMTMGTVLGGSGTTGIKPLLARAAGPALASLGVSGSLPDPTMTLTYTTPSPAVTVATNNDWNGDAALTTAFASVGAFPYTISASKDAAIFQPTLAPGNYTVEVRDTGAGSGTVISEIYDATPAGTFTLTTPRLVNVSVLKSIATGETLTAGFVIGGSTAKTVLIRAIGPGLSGLGVGGAMPDPQLALNRTSVNPSVVVATNNNWNGDVAISQAANRVGAFAITDTASRDAMLLMTLPPGNYTTDVSPTSGTTGGTAIVEVYDVP